MYPYPIRLHGPWDVAVAGAAPFIVTMPRLLKAASTVILRRRFGLPRTIDDFERVWLAAEAVRGSSIWRLNGDFLGEAHDASAEFEITARLRRRNELEVKFPNAMGDIGFAGDVGLLIRCAAFLRDLAARRTGDRIVVSGLIAGDWAEPLEIYLLAGGRSCGYSRCRAGDRFELQTDGPADAAELLVELVNRSAVWHSEHVALAPE